MQPSVEFIPPTNQTSPGSKNYSLKIISQKLNGKTLSLAAEGVSGEMYQLRLRRADRIASVKGARLGENELIISFENKPAHRFVRQIIEITLK